MQLRRGQRGRIAPALGLLTAELFAATLAHAQETRDIALPASINDDTESDLGRTRVDSAVLFYQEAGGRVQATEPVVSVTVNGEAGDIFSLRLTSDTLTGATPNGATPWKEEQAFVKGDTSTGASEVLTAPPHTLPIDRGFKDQRYAADASYSFLAGEDNRLTLGASISRETDYASYAVNLGVARDFFRKNTTLAIAANFEWDRSTPHTGTPHPLTPIDGLEVNTGPETKQVVSVVAGLTQVISRNWFIQVNYSYGHGAGYQTDPYRLISVVDRRTGGPAQYLYEGRPRSRVRHSLYAGAKGAVGSMVLDLSARAYTDSWGMRSITLQIADRVPIASRLYVEPALRYYRQSAADFFRYYLVSGERAPAFASSDVRLGKFSAVTLGLKLGFKIGRTNEAYVRGEYYVQRGDDYPPGVIGELAREKLFSGVKAANIMVGYSFLFD